ncbi:2,3-diaminopropionate biosynthesis protein SbnB [Streptomyces alboflavus]|uniref:2,3-diaminopropionate biosynthesis protein SbnB n=1 Tax=Streptomyces alboflavus TaxID=67267 RepID=UPI00368EFC05
MSSVPSFSVISGAQVDSVVTGHEKEILRLVENAYRLHGEGSTNNPDSYFLLFPDRPSSRIIALPASVGGEVDVHGIKWISSFPDNVEKGIPRASAVLILNDAATGYPFACLESSIISASRTAASAGVAATALSARRPGRHQPRRVGFIGLGLIARYIHKYLKNSGFEFDRIGLHDLSASSVAGFRRHLEGVVPTRSASAVPPEIVVHEDAEELIRSSDLVVLATTASEPYLTCADAFEHGPIVLNVSLRDLSPDVITQSYNIVDDIDHCLKANTSVHLTEQREGHREFIAGTLYDVLTGTTTPPADGPVVFSPFGLGVLDLVLAKFVHDQVALRQELMAVPGFFYDLSRHG